MADRERLKKLLEMLSSDFDGERANAAAMIAKMAKAEGKSIAELCLSRDSSNPYGAPQVIYRDRVVVQTKVVYRDRFIRQPSAGPKFDPPDTGSSLDRMRWVLQFPEHLTDWENEFAEGLIEKYFDDMDLSSAQDHSAEKIFLKVMRKEGEPLV